jgi:formylglycine-generating enzyme required for sulfatase activity
MSRGDESQTWNTIEEAKSGNFSQNKNKDKYNPQYEPIETYEVPLKRGVYMTFVKVHAGGFMMGADDKDKDADDHERPLHIVYLDEFWIGLTPVTNAQYQIFQESLGNSHLFQNGYQDHPVVNVSWFDAEAFCKWFGDRSRKNIRLPFETEWEKAARGVDGRLYPWGNDEPNSRLAHYYGDIVEGLSIRRTTSVSQRVYGKSPYGALDMAGNVLEWTISWYSEDANKKNNIQNQIDSMPAGFKVVRGGSWNLSSKYLRCSSHLFVSPDRESPDVGFRCVFTKEL